MAQVLDVERLVDEQRLGRFNVNLLVWSFLAMFADGYDITVLPFAATELARLWHIPPASFGPAFSASLVGILVGAPLLGYIGDRFGRRTAIVSGCAVYGLATLAVIWAGSLEQIIALRLITGIGLGGLMPNTIALNSELAPKRWRATLVVLMFIGVTIGSGAPSLVFRFLVPQYGWQVLFLIGGAAPLLISLGLAWFLPESVKLLALSPQRRGQLVRTARRMRPDLDIGDAAEFRLVRAAPATSLGLREIFSDGLGGITTLLWLCFSTALMTNYFLNSWMPLIFEQNGLTPGRAALATGCYHVGGTLGGLIVSLLLDRYGVIVMAILFALAAPFVAAIGLPGLSYGALATLVGLAGFCVLGAQFGNNASAGLLYPTAFRSQGVGWAFAVGRFGSVLGPLLGGVLVGMKLPLQQLFLAPAAPMIVGAAAAAWLARLCFLRFRALQLDDTPAARRGGTST